jgi:hypothetical protein
MPPILVLDLKEGVVRVRRVYTRGELKPSPEKANGARAVPIPAAVALVSKRPIPLDPSRSRPESKDARFTN